MFTASVVGTILAAAASAYAATVNVIRPAWQLGNRTKAGALALPPASW